MVHRGVASVSQQSRCVRGKRSLIPITPDRPEYDQGHGSDDVSVMAFKIRERIVEVDSLCVSCTRGTVLQRSNGDVQTFCTQAGEGIRVPVDVKRCSGYR